MKINGGTKILGIFGNPVHHSASPLMHNKAIEILGINFAYIPFLVYDIEIAVKSIKALNITGVNVTVPYKEKVIPFLDELTKEAKKIGAVNTIINENGSLIGDNTDGKGFIKSLKENLKFDASGQTCFIFGAGGAARSIITSLIFENIDKIFIYDIDDLKVEKITNLGKQIYAVKKEKIKNKIQESSLIINATPIGMEDDRVPFNLEYLSKENIVYDIIYNKETPLIKYAKENKIECINGLEMLLYQGVLSFELWTKQKPPVEDMRKVLEK